jgi:cell wall-associated NlpC family hydrolase
MYHITIYVGGGKMIEAPEPGKRVQLVPVRTHNLVPYVGRPAG